MKKEVIFDIPLLMKTIAPKPCSTTTTTCKCTCVEHRSLGIILLATGSSQLIVHCFHYFASGVIRTFLSPNVWETWMVLTYELANVRKWTFLLTLRCICKFVSKFVLESVVSNNYTESSHS